MTFTPGLENKPPAQMSVEELRQMHVMQRKRIHDLTQQLTDSQREAAKYLSLYERTYRKLEIAQNAL